MPPTQAKGVQVGIVNEGPYQNSGEGPKQNWVVFICPHQAAKKHENASICDQFCYPPSLNAFICPLDNEGL